MQINNLKNKKILIVGVGKEGLATIAYLKKILPNQEIATADKNKKTAFFSGPHYLDEIDNFDIIIKSPGVPSYLFKNAKAKITTPTAIFFENCRGVIVGITGTKGKSTTTSLIYKILEDAGKNVEIIGNIGKPAISALENDSKDKIYVFELSSFQLENLTKSPHVAVFLNIFEDHLDVYETFQAYQESKLNITKWQNENDYLVYNKNYEKILPDTEAKKIPFTKPQSLIDEKDIPLVGDFNLANVAASISVAKIFNVPENEIKASIKSFKPLKHRLQNIGTYRGITFYNDSIATNPTATMAAIDALGNELQTLIAGGYDRGLDYQDLAKKIDDSSLEVLITFPTTGAKIKPHKKLTIIKVSSMKEAIESAYQNTKSGKICLFSPAAASFNMFRNFEDRGDQFIKEVKSLK